MKENKIASALFVIGVLSITVGVISGLYYGSSKNFAMLEPLNGIIGWGLVINGVVWGIVFFGFSEIIKLLQGIYNQGVNDSSNEEVSSVSSEESLDEIRPVPVEVRREIESFYSKKGLVVQEIESMSKEDFFLVTLDGGQEIIELGGFKPIVHSVKK